MNNNESGSESDERRLGGIFLIIGWIIAFGLVGLLINKIMFSTKPPSIRETYAGTEITMYRDYDSHFRIKGSINGVPVTFLIDTGATSIAVSEKLAKQANLKPGATVETETANGNAVGYMSKIEDLNLGGVVLHNFSVVIIQNLPSNEALLGMNVLKNFDIQQTADSLQLIIPKGE